MQVLERLRGVRVFKTYTVSSVLPCSPPFRMPFSLIHLLPFLGNPPPPNEHAQAVLNLRRGHSSAAQSCCASRNPPSRCSAQTLSGDDGGDSRDSTPRRARAGDTPSPRCAGEDDGAKSTRSDDNSISSTIEPGEGAALRVKLDLGLLFVPQVKCEEQKGVDGGGVGGDGAAESSTPPSVATC